MKYNKAEYCLTFGIYGWYSYDSYYRIYRDLITLAFASMLKQSTMQAMPKSATSMKSVWIGLNCNRCGLNIGNIILKQS